MKSFKSLLTVPKLRQIPSQLLPQTLRTMILLPRVSRISIQYQKQPRQFFKLFHFIKKYAPSIRYYNPTIQVTRKIDPSFPPVPVIKVYVRENQEEKLLVELQANNYETEEDVLEGIIKAVNIEEQPNRME